MQDFSSAVDELLKKACPSIAYRLRLDILRQSPADTEMVTLQQRILQDKQVNEVLSWQQPDGWLSWNFHGAPSLESGIRLLCEKGVDSAHPVIASALNATEINASRLDRGLGKVGSALDQLRLGGALMIRAALFAQAGREDRHHVQEQIDIALDGFRAVLAVRSMDDISEPYKGKRIFKPAVEWPSIYHLRLLAFSQRWRTVENRQMLIRAIHRLIDLSPIPQIYACYTGQVMAPASFCMDDFNPRMERMTAAQWMFWFHRMELLSRSGITGDIPELQRQVDGLRELLQANGGKFALPLSHGYFKKWGSYTGLMLALTGNHRSARSTI